jgi:uncharacterized membrane protein/mono/diheme cytochrome c family protein
VVFFALSDTVFSVAVAPDAALPELGAVLTPTRFLGRLHPILVHVPIAFATAAGVWELWRALRRDASPNRWTPVFLWIAAIAALAAVGSGWMNAAWEYAKEPSDTLERHRWLGTAAAVLLVALAWLTRGSDRAPPFASVRIAQRLGAIAVAAVVGITAHLGGSLVYGEDYLLKGLWGRPPVTQPVRPPAGPPASVAAPANPPDPAALAMFHDRIEPLLEAHCASCHGPTKRKGGLRLVPIAAAFPEDRDTWAILPGDPDASELLIRVMLPPDDPDAMPPEKPLRPEEIEALRDWIAAGAPRPAGEFGSAASPATAAEPPPAIGAGLSPQALAAATAAIEARGGIVRPLYAGASQFDVSVSRAANPWTDEDLALLDPLASVIAELDLSQSRIGDRGLAALPEFPALTRLRLDGTAVSDVGVAGLGKHAGLTTVHLVGTQVSDAGLARLLEHPAMAKVFVWRSRVTSEGLARAQLEHAAIEVVGDVGGP